MVKTEGLLWMHVRGLVEHRPSTRGLPKQMFSWTTLRYSLHPSLSFCLPSFFLCHHMEKWAAVLLWSFYSAHCVFVFQSELCVNRSCRNMRGRRVSSFKNRITDLQSRGESAQGHSIRSVAFLDLLLHIWLLFGIVRNAHFRSIVKGSALMTVTASCLETSRWPNLRKSQFPAE